MAGKKRCEKINPAESLSKLQSHTLIWYLRIASYIAAPLLWHTSSSSTSETLEYALRIHFVILLALSHPGRVTICSASGVYSEVGSRKRDSSGTQAARKHNKGRQLYGTPRVDALRRNCVDVGLARVGNGRREARGNSDVACCVLKPRNTGRCGSMAILSGQWLVDLTDTLESLKGWERFMVPTCGP